MRKAAAADMCASEQAELFPGVVEVEVVAVPFDVGVDVDAKPVALLVMTGGDFPSTPAIVGDGAAWGPGCC